MYQAHVPQVAAMVLGPVPVPRRQRLLPGHQPHCERWVHAPQSVAEAHGSAAAVPASAVAVHCDESHDQPLAHDGPIVGASRPPVWQRPVAPQNPHEARAVQVPQVVEAAQGSPASATAPVSSRARVDGHDRAAVDRGGGAVVDHWRAGVDGGQRSGA